MQVTLEPPTGGPLITKTVEVDCGASGGITTFIFDQVTCQQLGLARGPTIQDIDINGHVRNRPTVWVCVNVASLNLRAYVLVKCYPQAPALSGHDGLVTLNFLDGYFSKWGGEKDMSGQSHFCMDRV